MFPNWPLNVSQSRPWPLFPSKVQKKANFQLNCLNMKTQMGISLQNP